MTSPHPPGLSGDAFAPLAPVTRFVLTAAPIAGFGLTILLTAFLSGPEVAGFLVSVAAGAVLGGGKLLILAGAVEQAPVGHWALAGLIVYIDLATALIVLGGMHHLYRLPGAGRRMAAARESGWRLLQRNPWMHRVTWLSLAGFVAVPFQGTGALVGVILGRLLGLSRISIVAATGIGSIAGSATLALAGDYWGDHITTLADRPLLGFGLVVIVAGLTILGSHRIFGSRTARGNRAGE